MLIVFSSVHVTIAGGKLRKELLPKALYAAFEAHPDTVFRLSYHPPGSGDEAAKIAGVKAETREGATFEEAESAAAVLSGYLQDTKITFMHNGAGHTLEGGPAGLAITRALRATKEVTGMVLDTTSHMKGLRNAQIIERGEKLRDRVGDALAAFRSATSPGCG